MAKMEEQQGLSAQDVAVLESVLDPDYPEALREVAQHLYEALLAEDSVRGLERRVLAEMALKQTERLSLEMGGANFYMHKGQAFRLSQRDRAMCRKFNGRNYSQLAREHDLTEMRVRQIIDAWQKEEYARRQVGLFGAETGPSGKRA